MAFGQTIHWPRLGLRVAQWSILALNTYLLYIRHGHLLLKWFWASVVILTILLVLGVHVRRRRAMPSWLPVPGTVDFAKVQEDPRTVLQRYLLCVRYTYYVRGERYSGLNVRRFHDEPDADAAAEGLSGGAVAVRYNPRDPDRSVLT